LLFVLSATASATPKIEHWTLANGARVYFVAAPDLPMVQLRAVFDAGSARDPAAREGLAMLTAGMLDEGTGDLDADAVATRFDSLGAQFGASAERDTAAADLRSLTEPSLLEPALDLYARLLREPAFPQGSLERERARALIALKRDEQDPGAVIEKTFYRALYDTHPYARDPRGSDASLKRLTREDLADFHRRHYVGRNAWLVIVGALNKREAQRVAEKVVGALPAGETLPPLPPVEMRTVKPEHHPFPASQSHLRLGQPAMTRPDPDFFPLHVGNYILGGGGLVSRLSDEVREKRGLSYSVYSYFMPLREKGPFTLGLQTRNATRAEALTLVKKVLADFIANGPTEQELAAAKKHLTGGFPLRLDSNRKIADQLAVIAFYGLPLDWLDQYPQRVEAVTVEQIRDAFRRRLDPARMVTVTLGG
jgi:zinc protease